MCSLKNLIYIEETHLSLPFLIAISDTLVYDNN